MGEGDPVGYYGGHMVSEDPMGGGDTMGGGDPMGCDGPMGLSVFFLPGETTLKRVELRSNGSVGSLLGWVQTAPDPCRSHPSAKCSPNRGCVCVGQP